MNMSKYWRSLSSIEKQALADKLGKSKPSLSNIFNGSIKAGAKLCLLIASKTKNQVSAKQLRPDIFK